jgi:hypothetical protein
VKYLGVLIDSKLSWKPHIEEKIKKAKEALFAARSTIGKIWGPSPKYAKWAYTSIVRPALTYGYIVWSRACEKQHIKHKLQTVQQLGLLQVAPVRLSMPTASL